MTQYCPVISRKLRRLGVPPNDLEDAVQRVFLVVSRKLDVIDSGEECAYMLGTATRIASDVRRAAARRVRREVALEDEAEDETLTDDLLELKRARGILDRVIARMAPELALVYVLVEGEGLTAQEVSLTVGIPLGTVASRLRRARSVVRHYIRQLGPGLGPGYRRGPRAIK